MKWIDLLDTDTWISWVHCHKWTTVMKDGYQYCKICGKAKLMLNECKHKWIARERIAVRANKGDIPHNHIYILQCLHCGELRKQTTYQIKDL